MNPWNRRLFRQVPNYIELPSSLTGVPCRIVAMVGKWFPTGCHKVGASFGCLAPRLVTGQFDVERHKAVWAVHRQLLPGRRVQLPAAGSAGCGYFARRDVPGAL